MVYLRRSRHRATSHFDKIGAEGKADVSRVYRFQLQKQVTLKYTKHIRFSKRDTNRTVQHKHGQDIRSKIWTRYSSSGNLKREMQEQVEQLSRLPFSSRTEEPRSNRLLPVVARTGCWVLDIDNYALKGVVIKGCNGPGVLVRTTIYTRYRTSGEIDCIFSHCASVAKHYYMIGSGQAGVVSLAASDLQYCI